MSKVDFNINNWRKKHVLKEGLGGVVSRRAFSAMPGMFRTEAVDHIDDKEAGQDYDELGDKDLDNDGDHDASDKYLHKRQGKVAKVTEDDDLSEERGYYDIEEEALNSDEEDILSKDFNIREWQKKFYGNKRNLKWG